MAPSPPVSSDDGETKKREYQMLFSLVVILLYIIMKSTWSMLPNAKSDIYDFLIIKMTRVWYKAVLDRLPGGARILDVGIGTATALVKPENKEILERKNIVVVGIDYEKDYIDRAGERVAQAGLADRVKLNCTSIYNPKLRSLFQGASRFDAIYFSGSLTLLPDPAAALKATCAMLTDNGLIYVTQTFQNKKSPIAERVKPLLQRFTSIDFGKVTYFTEIHEIATKAGLKILEDGPIPGSIDNSTQTARMVVMRPTSSSKRD